MSFERAVTFTLSEEGEYQCNPHDAGNWTEQGRRGELKGTKYGISALSFPALDIENLTENEARAIYRKSYWEPIRGDEWPERFAVALFDTAVNMGVGTAIRIAQRAVGAQQDGIVGPWTLKAGKERSESVIDRFIGLRIARHGEIAQKDPLAGTWLIVWYIRCVRLAMECAK